MRPVLVMGWLMLFGLLAVDVFVELSRRCYWCVACLVLVLVLLWVLRRAIVRAP